MNDLDANHRLFRELRNGFLWHCTSPGEFLLIQADGEIKLNDGRVEKWGKRKTACQQLGGISLFDFSTAPAHELLKHIDRWHQFLGCASPTTVILGMPKERLPGKLVPYPENRDSTPEALGPIPLVEVCHTGNIPTSAITIYLIASSRDYSRFRRFEYDRFDKISFKRRLAKFEADNQVANSDQPEIGERIREFNRRLDTSRDAC